MIEPIRRLDRAQIDDAAELMVDAFYDSPFLRCMLSDNNDTRYRQRLRWLYRKTLLHGVLCGEVWAAADLAGVAHWFTPQHPTITFFDSLRTGLVWAPFKLGFAAEKRLSRVGRIMSDVHHEAVPEPHWFLSDIAVERQQRGHGVGTALMRQITNRADLYNERCYLETMTAEPVQFYNKLGFDTVQEITVPGYNASRVFIMVREPVCPTVDMTTELYEKL